MTELPKLLDCRGVMDETGVKRAVAESLMREIPKVRVGRRVFVKRDDVLRELERRTIAA